MMYDILVNCKWVDNPVAVVQYTFIHKQYREQHIDIEYTGYYICNNENT
jgi:hypothetical protein